MLTGAFHYEILTVSLAGTKKQGSGIRYEMVHYMHVFFIFARVILSCVPSNSNLDMFIKKQNSSDFIFYSFIKFELKAFLTEYQITKTNPRLFWVSQMAIPIIVGAKFDEFIQLPIDLQWTIASQV